jgi:hypothetical protein
MAVRIWVWSDIWGKLTLYPLITYHMKKTGLLIQDNIVVMNSDTTATVIRNIQTMRLDYVLYMVFIN